MSGSEPAFEGQRPPFANGNEAATTHGRYSERRFGPLAERILERERAAMGDLWDGTSEVVLGRYAALAAQCELLEADIDAHGVVDECGQVRPAVREALRLSSRILEYGKELAATVRSRAQLDLERLRRDQGLLTPAEVQPAFDAVLRSALEAVAAVVGAHVGERTAALIRSEFGRAYLAKLDDVVAQLGGALELPAVEVDEETSRGG